MGRHAQATRRGSASNPTSLPHPDEGAIIVGASNDTVGHHTIFNISSLGGTPPAGAARLGWVITLDAGFTPNSSGTIPLTGLPINILTASPENATGAIAFWWADGTGQAISPVSPAAPAPS